MVALPNASPSYIDSSVDVSDSVMGATPIIPHHSTIRIASSPIFGSRGFMPPSKVSGHIHPEPVRSVIAGIEIGGIFDEIPGEPGIQKPDPFTTPTEALDEF